MMGPSKTIISFSVGLILALGEHVPYWYHGKNLWIFVKVASNHGKFIPSWFKKLKKVLLLMWVLVHPSPCALADSTTTTTSLVIVLMDPSHSCASFQYFHCFHTLLLMWGMTYKNHYFHHSYAFVFMLILCST